MPVHEALSWGIHAALTEFKYLPVRNNSGLGKYVDGMNESMIRILQQEMLQHVELHLKTRVKAFYTKNLGGGWWTGLPERVRLQAARRHRWSAEVLGARRVVEFPNICWLTMGDLMKVFEDLSTPNWQACLGTTGRRRVAFANALRHIKAFRDYHVAHPKPRDITTSEIRLLCHATYRAVTALQPHDWQILVSVMARNADLSEACVAQLTRRMPLVPNRTVRRRMPIIERWWWQNFSDWDFRR